MPIKREQCPTCKRTISRKLNGEFYAHAMSAGSFASYAYHHGRCPMSNKAPTPSEEPGSNA